MVAQLFLFSALSTGTALTMLAAPRIAPAGEVEEDRRLLLSADVIFILLELFIIVPYVIHGELSALAARESLGLILGGPLTLTFWLGVVLLGLLVPLTVEALELVPTLTRELPLPAHRYLDVAIGLLVLMGGFLLRYVFVRGGQLSEFI